MIHRIEGDHEAAVNIIDTVIHQQQPNTHTPRDTAAIGHLKLQRALNYVQVDDLPHAEQVLEEWRPLGDEPSLMEQVVYFRRGVTLGRVLRTQGRFSEAHTHLKRSQDLAEQLRDLTFNDDRRDLTCEMADTLRELDKPEAAEVYLRREFARRGEEAQDPAASGKSLLEASLAEVLFAQGRTEEAERLCVKTESRADNLMKLGKLRICVVLAKIYHTRSNHEGALRYWDEAMRQVAKFPWTTGRTTHTILLSRRENMRFLGITDARDQFLQHTASSDALGTPGGMLYWIAGLRHWQNYLDSEATWSRM
ncbi:putative and nb-arc domain [Diaporthe ampelina]|uniref:Putative and nb-arc domain n=1 Tax=Diaporthe ampelina TaxID=1214573 RepID=A0A0G2HFN6_9PEZI|nr:putative and nb-arc domain [Diaporthe ampelina]